MRPLTNPEMKAVFDKLGNYCDNLTSLIAPLEDGDRYVLRLNHSRVRFFFSLSLLFVLFLLLLLLLLLLLFLLLSWL